MNLSKHTFKIPHYYVVLRKNDTGDVRSIPMTDVKFEPPTPDYDGSVYWWTEGNMGCDCNRFLLFHDYPVDVEAKCGSGGYTLLRIDTPEKSYFFDEEQLIRPDDDLAVWECPVCQRSDLMLKYLDREAAVPCDCGCLMRPAVEDHPKFSAISGQYLIIFGLTVASNTPIRVLDKPFFPFCQSGEVVFVGSPEALKRLLEVPFP